MNLRLYYTAVQNPNTPPRPPANSEANSESTIPMPVLSRWRRMQIPVIAWLVYLIVRLIGPTLRFEVVGVHNATNLRDAKVPTIGAFWHRCIFSAIWIWRGRGIVVMNTVNFDGQWTRRVIERLGFGTAQGSSTRGAMEGLMVMAQRLEEGHSVALTIDGPRGPRFVAKPGAVILARRTGHPVSIFHIGLKNAHTLQESWDLFQIPYPFTQAVMFVAPPIRVPADASSEVMHEMQREIQATLERTRDLAESWFSLSEPERDRIRAEWRDKSSE